MSFGLLIIFYMCCLMSGGLLCWYYQKEYQLSKTNIALILGIGLALSTVWLLLTGKILHLYWLHALLFGVLGLLIFVDFKYQDLPDEVNGLIALLGLGQLLFVANPGSHLLTAVCLFAGFLVLAMLTGALGGGDIKFSGAIGLWFAPSAILLFLEASAFSGALVALFLILVKKHQKDAFFCFGPFLILGALIVLI